MVLLNLIASLSLVAAVGVPAVVSSQSEIEGLSVSYLDRKNSMGFVDGYVFQNLDLTFDSNYYVFFDGILPVTELEYDMNVTYSQGYGIGVHTVTNGYTCHLLVNDVDEFGESLNLFIFDGEWHYLVLDDTLLIDDFYGLYFYGTDSLQVQNSYRVIVSSDDLTLSNLPNYLESKDIVPSITSGLGVVSNLASGLVGGFDSLALNNGALTNVMAFAFTLLGIGTAVGLAKLCFNWVTGRHGM